MTSRNKMLSLRLTVTEYQELKERAEALGVSINTYCREVLFQMQSENRWPKHRFASALCEHHNLVDRQVYNERIKTPLFQWEEEVWQLIK